VEAIDEAIKSAKEFEDFDTAVSSQRPLESEQWKASYTQWFELKGWERNDMDCPFQDFSESKCPSASLVTYLLTA
jgi:hypothetical protein